MNPERGGSPARERRAIGIVAFSSGFLVHAVASLFRFVALAGARDMKVVKVRVR